MQNNYDRERLQRDYDALLEEDAQETKKLDELRAELSRNASDPMHEKWRLAFEFCKHHNILRRWWPRYALWFESGALATSGEHRPETWPKEISHFEMIRFTDVERAVVVKRVRLLMDERNLNSGRSGLQMRAHVLRMKLQQIDGKPFLGSPR